MKQLLALLFLCSVLVDFTPNINQLGAELISNIDHCSEQGTSESDSHHDEERHCEHECHLGHTHVAIFNELPLVKENQSFLSKKNKIKHIVLKPRNFIDEVIRPPIS